uniref:Uncharacterized protein n=1 Tax=Nelumbo nucifera TaxID=4432 RepID=A0A822XSR6_NELNU|nr:TPA_asm: hypothetical protein HUJ06_026118 [Nelumbo nucifera]
MLELKKTNSSILVSKKWLRKKTKDLVDEKNQGDEVACKIEKNPSMAEVPELESDQAKNLGLGRAVPRREQRTRPVKLRQLLG